ncbi:uncharacterized protein LOC122347841 [Puntigrus tetrazona]|uniref:uncharacterized protein LOC122347841 n=1 Tax=Puntigrus tetrazona TaxID=1606681 RepID=UPI001C89BF00|nr:uncharacterized protein LOC122347841 [Puntigrus tetrazona]
MVHIIISALLICGTGFLTAKASQSTNITAQPGDDVTIWCKHTSDIGNYIYWFKQKNCAVPLSIVYMMLTYNLSHVKATYLNGFRPDHLVMSLNSKNTSLKILNVAGSDSGLYYCGWQMWKMTFGDGTQLEIKERRDTPLQTTTENTNKDLNKSPISTRDCSESIFYKLTFIFGGIIVILIIIPLIMLFIKIQDRNTQEKDSVFVAADVDCHETNHHEEPHPTVYAALKFSKHNYRRSARKSEHEDVVYSAK